jgi:two-component system, cell cycle response regulator
MDAKAITHFCESPLNSSRSDSGLAHRQSAYLIVIRGGLPGTMLRVGPDDTTLGRSADNSFSLDDMTVSRRHATLRVDALGLVTITDDGSTNGTFLNGRRIDIRRTVSIEEGDRLQLGSGVLLKLVRLDASDEHFQQEMFERTVRDGLTGVYNRSYFLNQVGRLAGRYTAQGVGLAIMMVDVDHFKRINDRYGHVTGDLILREVSSVIRESTRAEDLVARYGGEEFILALPASSPELAAERADRIRMNVGARRIRTSGGEVRVTVSIGLAYRSHESPIRPMSLIEAADEALYQAKADGRNCVILAQQALSPMSRETQSVELLTSP